MLQRVLPFLLCLAAAAQEHAGQYSQVDVERCLRLYGFQCVFCHGANGDLVPRVDLQSGKFRHATSDEELARVILSGVPGTAMPPHKLDTAEVAGLIAYLRTMRDYGSGGVKVGDASRGQAVFEGKGQCLGCHRVRERGSRVAPDLSEIGAVRRPDALQQSLLDPTAAMLPMNRSIRAVAKDGKVITGRRLNEDTYSVQLIDSGERLVSLNKAELREYTVVKTSPMPSYRDKLSAGEVSDVLAYLLTLKGVDQ